MIPITKPQHLLLSARSLHKNGTTNRNERGSFSGVPTFHWLWIESGRRGVTAFSCLPTVEPKELQWIASRIWSTHVPGLIQWETKQTKPKRGWKDGSAVKSTRCCFSLDEEFFNTIYPPLPLCSVTRLLSSDVQKNLCPFVLSLCGTGVCHNFCSKSTGF